MKPLQILIVEDNEGDVILFQEALEHHHIEHQLHVASDGQSCSRLCSPDGNLTGDTLPRRYAP